ncbi:hypothetical protein EG68_01965 [Paragonimus skrjabini miyazakii]|uniref:Uncharacterized protein n=1 Tax=Paragonimus skrjabini miyazakii TaxID=59628 RepID=A0A8S9Z0B8_9TREM|nr:hypothetical protein EG68_01965 [Paragonimus skrjabini miyazakii]
MIEFNCIIKVLEYSNSNTILLHRTWYKEDAIVQISLPSMVENVGLNWRTWKVTLPTLKGEIICSVVLGRSKSDVLLPYQKIQ